MKRRIAISAGHSNTKGRDEGAVGNGYIEGELTVELRQLVYNYILSKGIKCSIDKNDSVTFETVALFKQYFGAEDILIDIHFNSASPLATGTETLVPAEYDEFEYSLAYDLSRSISNVLNIKNRGVKTELESARKKLLWMTLKSKTVLIETCFISNKKEIENYIKNKENVARAIGDILIAYTNK